MAARASTIVRTMKMMATTIQALLSSPPPLSPGFGVVFGFNGVDVVKSSVSVLGGHEGSVGGSGCSETGGQGTGVKLDAGTKKSPLKITIRRARNRNELDFILITFVLELERWQLRSVVNRGLVVADILQHVRTCPGWTERK